MSSETTEVEATPEVAVKDVNERFTGLDQSALAKRFSAATEVDVPEEVEDTSDITEVEEPASEVKADSEPDEEEDSITEDDIEDVEGVDEEALKGKEKPPVWWKERLDKYARQRRKVEDELLILKNKLDEREQEVKPVGTVDQVTDLAELTKLEQQAMEAQDTVDELLDTEPTFNDEGEAVWKIGDNELTKKQLIDIRKNARTSFRAIPERKRFLEQKSKTEANMEKISFFSDPQDPYYKFAQDTLNSKLYKDIQNMHPDAKAAVALMIKGKMAIDAEQNKTEAKAAVKTPSKLKSTVTGKAATDTGTTAPTQSNDDLRRKRIDKLKKTPGGVDSAQAVDLFR